MNDLRLSFTIACHGKDGYLGETLDSILNCGYHFRDTEIVIFDDASPLQGGDGNIARDYAARHPDLIRVLRTDINQGIAKARAVMVDASRGCYFLVFDSDDVFLNFDIDGSLDFLDRHPEYCATNGKKRLFSAEKGDIGENHGGPFSYFLLAFDPCVCHNGMIMRRSDVLEIGNYQEPCPGQGTVAEDIFLWCRLGLRKNIIFENSYRALYRKHGNQLTAELSARYQPSYDAIRKFIIAQYPDLYQSLLERRPVTVTPENRVPVTVLLGIMYKQVENDAKLALELLDTAAKVAPEDYGIREYRARLFIREKRYLEALNECFQMQLQFSGEQYINLNVMCKLQTICKETGLSGDAFSRFHRDEVEKFFYLTPEQQLILKQAVAGAK